MLITGSLFLAIECAEAECSCRGSPSPPRFAVQKVVSPRSAAAFTAPSAEASPQGSHQPWERLSLQLDVIAGPAKGRTFRAADDQVEVGWVGLCVTFFLSCVSCSMGRGAFIDFEYCVDCRLPAKGFA